MRDFDTKTCYHCDAESSGREHVPPKCLFPKGNDWSRLMTVPSCATHNNATSKADEYLKFLLGAIASNTPDAIISSAARSAIRLAQMRSRNLKRYGLRWDREVLVIGDDFRLNFDLLSASLEKIARALFFLHRGGEEKLLCELTVWPLFIPVEPEVDPELASAVAAVRATTAEAFEQLPMLGSHQEIFAYQIVETSTTVLVNMDFYGGHRASVMGITDKADKLP